MCSQGCASTAWPFRLSPFSLAIVSYSPVPLLRSQTPCLPSFSPCFLFVSWYSYGPLSPVLALPSSPWRRRGTSPQVQCLRLPPTPSPPLPPALPSVLRGFLTTCLQCWAKCTGDDAGKITSSLPLQGELVRLQLHKHVHGSARHLIPYPCRTRHLVQPRPWQQERPLCAKSEYSISCSTTALPSPLIFLLCGVMHTVYHLHGTLLMIGMHSLAHGSPLVIRGNCFFPSLCSTFLAPAFCIISVLLWVEVQYFWISNCC